MADTFTTQTGEFKVTGESRKVVVEVGGVVLDCERHKRTDRTVWTCTRIRYQYGDAGHTSDLFGSNEAHHIESLTSLWRACEDHWTAWRETKKGRKQRLRELEDRIASLEKNQQ